MLKYVKGFMVKLLVLFVAICIFVEMFRILQI